MKKKSRFKRGRHLFGNNHFISGIKTFCLKKTIYSELLFLDNIENEYYFLNSGEYTLQTSGIGNFIYYYMEDKLYEKW